MKFLKPVPAKISAAYGEWGPYWNHYLSSSGQWLRGKLNGLGQHKGTDFACPENTVVVAICDGLIVRAGWENPADIHQGFGLRVRQQIHFVGKRWTIVYGHLSAIHVREGQQIVAGDRIGLSGASGHVTGPHLHIELVDDAGQYAYLEFQDDQQEPPLVA